MVLLDWQQLWDVVMLVLPCTGQQNNFYCLSQELKYAKRAGA